MKQVDIIAHIADLKDTDYRNTLAIATLIELLIDKKIIFRKEFAQKSYFLDSMTLEELKEARARF